MTGAQQRIEDFVAAARALSVDEAVDRLAVRGGLRRAGGHELVGPCPLCGGVDAFSINTAKNAWNCRKASYGGRDGISLAGHLAGLPQSLDRREDFLAACAAALNEAVPDGGEESDADRDEREKRRQAAQEKAQREAEKRDEEANRYRAKSRAQAREKLASARRGAPGFDHRAYLARRLGARLDELERVGALPPFAGTIPAESYFHRRAGRKSADRLGAWPAMALPFIDADGATIGAHLTWLDFWAGRRRVEGQAGDRRSG